MEVTEHGAPVLTFGKYKNACAQCVAEHDPGYAQWCLAQEDMHQCYPEVFAYWRATGITPLEYCTALTREGNPCKFWAKYEGKCKRHFHRDSADDFTSCEIELVSA